MGTPAFAVGILDSILKNKYDIVGVITAPDKPAGRGQKLSYSAVKEYALVNKLPILQPANLKDEIFLAELKALNANLQVVVAFRMLPKAVWKMPELGTFNLHASLLPEYRGAAPINWAIINGESKTGVTTFFIDDKIDTGRMILSSETQILPDENVGQLHDRLMQIGSDTVIKTLQQIENNAVVTTIQEDLGNHKTAFKLHKENCRINWSNGAIEIYNFIRGLSPYPAAWCIFKDGEVECNAKIYEASKILEIHTEKVGQIITTKKEIKIAVHDGFIIILQLQLSGKKKMAAHELLNGTTFSEKAYAC